MSRTPSQWSLPLLDTPSVRAGGSALHFALHPQGYAIYRVHFGSDARGPRYRLTVIELVATTPVAHAALWRYLLDVDWVAEVRYPKCPVTDPISSLLADGRQAIRRHLDALWLRIVDVDRALAARHYSAPLDVVFEVVDRRCPWNEGRWRLSVDQAGTATVVATAEAADLTIGAAELGAIFLGSTRLSTLAAGGLVREHRAGAIAAASRSFLADPVPYCTVDF